MFSRKHKNAKQFSNTALIVVIFILAALFILFQFRVALYDMYEDAVLTIHPTAQEAYTFATMHFDAGNRIDYDLDRAQRDFQIAASLDPNIPYVYHELARIQFLKGNFSAALELIDLQIKLHGDTEPNSYYVRGLIEGYMGDYSDAATDYAHFLPFDPNDWAAMNDDAWVLLKADRFQDAANITAKGLVLFPDNPWLLNSSATALYELGDYKDALAAAQKASVSVAALTEAQWSHAYPGNDPAVAGEGLDSFKTAITDNIHTIEKAMASSTIQSE